MNVEIIPDTASAAVDSVKGVTVDPVLLQWSEAFEFHMQRGVAFGDPRPSTRSNYLLGIRTWMAWCEDQGLYFQQVTTDDVELYRAYLREEINGRQRYADSTAQVLMTAVRQFYAAGVRRRLIASNPADGVKMPTPGDPLNSMKALSEAGLVALINSIDPSGLIGLRDRVIIAVMAIHGLRREEVQRLNHGDVREEDAWRIYIRGKGGRGNVTRYGYIREDVKEVLDAWICAKAGAGIPCGENDPLVVSLSPHGYGDRLGTRSLNRVVDKYLDAATLKRDGVSCHALRHTYGTQAVAGGAKVEQVQAAMGHANLETTGVYVKAVERRRHDPAQFIGPRFAV